MEDECIGIYSQQSFFSDKFNALKTNVEIGNVKGVTELLDKYTNDDLESNIHNFSAFMFQAVQRAPSRGQVDVMHALLHRGYYYDSENYPDLTQLITACVVGDLNVVKALVEKHGVSPDQAVPKAAATSLLAALRNPDKIDVIECLLSAGASTNKQSSDGTSPLVLAAGTCSTEICKVLLSHGAEVNTCDGYHKIPLCAAVCADKVSNVLCLLDAGADVNPSVNDMLDSTPFQDAIYCGNVPMMRLLHSRGAWADDSDTDCNTPLHLAALNGPSDIAKYLAVELGVETDISNSDAMTPFRVGYIDIADLLIKSGYNPKPEELMFDEGDLILSRTGMDEAIKRWKQTLSVPRRLQDLCIFQIRRCVRNQSALFSLPLPKHFINEIVMLEGKTIQVLKENK